MQKQLLGMVEVQFKLNYRGTRFHSSTTQCFTCLHGPKVLQDTFPIALLLLGRAQELGQYRCSWVGIQPPHCSVQSFSIGPSSPPASSHQQVEVSSWLSESSGSSNLLSSLGKTSQLLACLSQSYHPLYFECGTSTSLFNFRFYKILKSLWL